MSPRFALELYFVRTDRYRSFKHHDGHMSSVALVRTKLLRGAMGVR